MRRRFGDQTLCRFEEMPNGKISGEVISPQFAEMGGLERQKLIWEALDQEFRADAPLVVSVLLAYTPEEWDMPLEGFN